MEPLCLKVNNYENVNEKFKLRKKVKQLNPESNRKGVNLWCWK